MGLVNVAMPHKRGDTVLKTYVSRFIRMLEEIADRKALEEGKDRERKDLGEEDYE